MGDTLEISYWDWYTWQAVGETYNMVAAEQNWPLVNMTAYAEYQTTYCQIVGFFGEPYGKFPNGANMVAFMEFDYWFQNAVGNLYPLPP